MKLIPNWRQALRFASVRLCILGAALPPAWLTLTQEQRDAILGFLGLSGSAALISGIFGLVAAVRLVKQSSLDKPQK